MRAKRNQSRQSEGTPAGGQFAGKTNPESELELGAEPEPAAEWASDRRKRIADNRAAAADEERRSSLFGLKPSDTEGEIWLRMHPTGADSPGIETPEHYRSSIASQVARDEEKNVKTTPRIEAARALYEDRLASRENTLGRHLTMSERDALALKIQMSYPVKLRPGTGYQYAPVTQGMDAVGEITTDYVPGPAEVDVIDTLESWGRVDEQKLALAFLATPFAPWDLVGTVRPRDASAARAEVSDSGGVRAVAARWSGGDSILFTPFKRLTEEQRNIIVTRLGKSSDAIAEKVWLSALTGAVKGVRAA